MAEGIEWEEFEIAGSPGNERIMNGSAGLSRKDSKSGNVANSNKEKESVK